MLLKSENYTIKYIEYDWRINQVEKPGSDVELEWAILTVRSILLSKI